jgi:DNA-binding MarR family transcriptional regulator
MTSANAKATSRGQPLTKLILEVFQLNGRLLQAGDALVADIGLTSARWQVIGAIALSPVPLPVAHIARNMGLARQSVRRVVGELEKDGLVRFAANPHHERAKLVLLTERGAAAHRDAMIRQGPWVTELRSGLKKKDIEAAGSLLHELRRRLELHNGRRPARGTEIRTAF